MWKPVKCPKTREGTRVRLTVGRQKWLEGIVRGHKVIDGIQCLMVVWEGWGGLFSMPIDRLEKWDD